MSLYWSLHRTRGVAGPRDSVDLLRRLVTAMGICEWQGLTHSDTGKPQLRGASGVEISSSRSGQWVLVGAARQMRVGVDIEAVTSVFDQSVLARRTCTAYERRSLAEMPPPTRREALADLWTTKEALLKCEGSGLRRDPRSIQALGARHLRLKTAFTGVSAAIVVAEPDDAWERTQHTTNRHSSNKFAELDGARCLHGNEERTA